MVGGDDEAVGRLTPVLEALAPGRRRRRAHARPRAATRARGAGLAALRPAGAGHFVKMVHNGIEYGLMQAYAEGLNVLKHANIGKHAQETDAETTPLRDPELYKYDLDMAEVTEVWRRGSVIASWLLDLTAEALHETPSSTSTPAASRDSGEGRWTIQAAIERACPRPCSPLALLPVRLPRRGGLRRPHPFRNAQGLRRPPRKPGTVTETAGSHAAAGEPARRGPRLTPDAVPARSSSSAPPAT